MTETQDTLPLTDDDREAHALYLASPPSRCSDRGPRHPLYWRGLIADLTHFQRERAAERSRR